LRITSSPTPFGVGRILHRGEGSWSAVISVSGAVYSFKVASVGLVDSYLWGIRNEQIPKSLSGATSGVSVASKKQTTNASETNQASDPFTDASAATSTGNESILWNILDLGNSPGSASFLQTGRIFIARSAAGQGQSCKEGDVLRVVVNTDDGWASFAALGRGSPV